MKAFKKVLVPIDFSANSKKVLGAAVYVAEKFEADLSVVFVVQTLDDYSGFFVPHMPVAKLEEDMVQGAEAKMAGFLEGIEVSASHVLNGDVVEEISGHAEEQEVDLIVMGTHGYKGLERIVFGSIAEKVVKSASCPVMTINPYKTDLE